MLLGLTKRGGTSLRIGLKHWWTFEEPFPPGTIFDNVLSGVNLNTSGFGGPGSYTTVAGLVNNASHKTFDSYFRGTAPISLQTGDFTIVGVFATTAGNLGIIAQNGDVVNTDRQWIVTVEGTFLKSSVSTTGTSSTTILNTGIAVNNGAFHTYMFWRDTANNLLALQLDGHAPITTPLSGSTVLWGPLTHNVTMGGIGGGTYLSDGIFDETGIWTRVLTPAERTFLYNGGAWRTYSDF